MRNAGRLLILLLLPVIRGDIAEELARISVPLEAGRERLMERLAGARLVLMGESTHGTSEFYRKRAEWSRNLIEKHGFRFVAVEGDWNSIWRLNRYVLGYAHPEGGAREIMRDFDRWPQWMWANEEFADFTEWLRVHNQSVEPSFRVGLYGVDIYGHMDAIRELPERVGGIDEEFGAWIRAQYDCFRPFLQDFGQYARASHPGPFSPCATAAVSVVRRLREWDALEEQPEAFHLKQMALVVKHAERHYRSMGWGGAASWNHRAAFFFQTARRLLEAYGEEARGIVWAHNTHIGDARATPMVQGGQINIGQLAREELGVEQVASLGFGTHRGHLIAGHAWGAPRRRMPLPAAMPGSLEDLLQQTGEGNRILFLEDATEGALDNPIPHRAVGVVYSPGPERPGQYVPTRLAERYDVFVFLEETTALAPVE